MEDKRAFLGQAFAGSWIVVFEHDPTVTWADAFVALASERPARDRHVVLVHLRSDEDGTRGHLHVGPALPNSLRRQMGCDGRARIVYNDTSNGLIQSLFAPLPGFNGSIDHSVTREASLACVASSISATSSLRFRSLMNTTCAWLPPFWCSALRR